MGSKITQFVKTNLTLVICGALAVLSITLVALGVFLPGAQAELDADKNALTGLQAISGKAVNDKVIEEVRRKQNEIRRNVQTFLAASAKIAPRTLLHQEVFPETKEQFDSAEFKNNAAKKRRELISLLHANDQPSQQDIDDYREQMLKAKQQAMLQEGKTPEGNGILPMPGLAPAARPGEMSRPGNPLANNSAMPENMAPEEWIKEDPQAGASVKRAQEVYCYASEESLDPRCKMSDKYPIPEIMWEAQLSLWMQEDIIQVLARINNEATAQLSEDQRFVANLPVKHLLYIACGDYLKPSLADMGSARAVFSGGAESGSKITDPVPPSPSASFTKRAVGEQLDVVPLAVGLVIDSTYLLRVMDELSKSGFYTPLCVNYEVIPYDPTLRGYVYGSAPVIRVRLELEHCILRDKLTVGDKKYVDLMPAKIKSGTWVSPAREGRGGGTPGPMINPNRGGRGGMRREQG